MWEHRGWAVRGLLNMRCQSFLLPVWCRDLMEVGALVKRSWV